MKYSGFTLIELIISCALLCFIIGITLTSFSWLDSSRVHADIAVLAAACRFMQWQAHVEHTPKKITFDTQKQIYYCDDEIIQLSKNVRFGVVPGAKGPPSSAHSLIHDPITFTHHEIRFNHNGIIQAGTLYLINEKRNCMAALSCGVGHISCLRKYTYQDGWVRVDE